MTDILIICKQAEDHLRYIREQLGRPFCPRCKMIFDTLVEQEHHVYRAHL